MLGSSKKRTKEIVQSQREIMAKLAKNPDRHNRRYIQAQQAAGAAKIKRGK